MPGSQGASELLAIIDDGRWWERADCFSHPQARKFVPDLDGAMLALRHLFPADVCIDLARQGHGKHVYGLFLGGFWNDRVDELLQLGSDLSLCVGWRDDKKLLANLRDLDAYEAARFEVGTWAGLHRVGLVPEHEPAENPATRRADFRVRDGAQRVAIELKSLADPKRARNLGALFSCLSRAATASWSEMIGSIALEPSTRLEDQLDGDFDAFVQQLDATIWPAIERILGRRVTIGRHEISDIGVIVVGPRDDDAVPNLAGHLSIHCVHEWTLERAAARVVGRIDDAGRQLAATEADLRVAVVWGGLDHFPSGDVATEILRRLDAGLRIDNVDYIGIVNSHRRGARSGWTTDAAVRALHAGCPSPETMTWPRALSAWGLLHRAGAA